MKTESTEPKIHTGTHDGFLYMTCRASGVEAVDEKKIIYEVNITMKSCSICGKQIYVLHSVQCIYMCKF